MTFRFKPEKLRRPEEDHILWDEFYDRARFCILIGVTPSEYDAMSDIEVAAFVQAYNDVQKEQQRGA